MQKREELSAKDPEGHVETHLVVELSPYVFGLQLVETTHYPVEFA